MKLERPKMNLGHKQTQFNIAFLTLNWLIQNVVSQLYNEIITDDRSLFDRIFAPLKYLLRKHVSS
jgi:hypothetical protein